MDEIRSVFKFPMNFDSCSDFKCLGEAVKSLNVPVVSEWTASAVSGKTKNQLFIWWSTIHILAKDKLKVC